MPEQVIEATDAEEEVRTCDICEEHGDGRWMLVHDNAEEHECDVCYELGHHRSTHEYCNECSDYADHSTRRHRCHNCGEYARHCGYCGDCDETQCECRCESDCDDEEGDCFNIHDYSWQPPVIRYMGMVGGESLDIDRPSRNYHAHSYPPPPDSQPYLGLEIECEGMEGPAVEIAKAFNAHLMGWSKTDGSLMRGVECVTFPVTYARLEHDGSLPRALREMAAAGGRAWGPGNCGLHIHVSRPSFKGKSHQWRFAAAHESMSAVLRVLSGRDPNAEGYCAWDAKTHEPTGRQSPDRFGWVADDYRTVDQKASKIVAGKQLASTRYVSVNVTDGTIELRFWRGSLQPDHVMGAAALEDGIQQWTRDMSLADVRRSITGQDATATWKAFQTWAGENLPQHQNTRIYKLAKRRHVAMTASFIRAAHAAKEVTS